MNTLEAVFFGIVQGLTEFLPISSSGHLVLAQSIFEAKQAGVTFEILLHVGTMLSVIIYFHRRLWEISWKFWKPQGAQERKLVFFLAIGTLPAIAAVLLAKDFVESAFSSPLFAASMLIITGVILLLPRFFIKRRGTEKLTLPTALAMGCGQALALLPGISRSGTTITAGILCRRDPAKAAEFSFLLLLPAMVGAVVLKLPELNQLNGDLLLPYLAGTAASFVTGLLAVYIVLATVKKGNFHLFSLYCFLVGGAALVYFGLK